jgi:alpha-beta hydrolase superfamily lysophospholipase
MRLARHLGLFIVYGAMGAILVALAGALFYLENREDLATWHRADLPSEYQADSEVTSFQAYLALEDVVFAELAEEVIEPLAPDPSNVINRYAQGSISSPDRWQRDWNRSYELMHADPVAGVLMLHGMSDSPYSLRAIAERLHAEGVYVVGLRYPGHGTAPASLTRATWEDMYGAVELAARHLEDVMKDKPVYVFGYSTGGPLAVELSLRALESAGAQDSAAVPLPDGLILFSPAMGVTPLAALTPWQARLGRVLGLEKVGWNSIEIEYDPFKYRSFPLNAAVQVWRLARHVDAGLVAAAETGLLREMPPILSFQSVVDSTIAAPAVIDVLYNRLPERSEGPHHALVVYDFNRSTEIEPLLTADPRSALDTLLKDHSRPYELTVVSNTRESARSVRATTGAGSGRAGRSCLLSSLWPTGSYSLSHIAPTFPPDDPLYGGTAREEDHIQLGKVVLRGESGALRVSSAGFLRQTFNPFFDYQLGEIGRFMNLALPPSCSPQVD